MTVRQWNLVDAHGKPPRLCAEPSCTRNGWWFEVADPPPVRLFFCAQHAVAKRLRERGRPMRRRVCLAAWGAP